MSSLLLIPLDDTVVFPTMDVTLPVDTAGEDRVLLVPRHDGEYAPVGTIAEVTDTVRLPGGGKAVTLSGVARGVVGAGSTDAAGHLRVEVTEHPDTVPVDGRTRDLEREYRALVEEILEMRGADSRVNEFLRAIREPGALADTIGYAPDVAFEEKVEVLGILDVTDRLARAVELQRERVAELQVRRRIRDDVQSGAEKQQREYILRRQMDSIRRELGEDDASVVEEYRVKIDEAGMPDAVREQADKELGRLERLGEQGGEAGTIRTYLDWLLQVPWKERSEERLDPIVAREVLDADHAGLEDVKDRIVEYIAVKKLRKEREIAEDKRSGAILTLIGPPGTGKTSIGESIAPALRSISTPRSWRSLRTAMYSVMRSLTSSRPAWSASSTSRAWTGSSISSEVVLHGTETSQSRYVRIIDDSPLCSPARSRRSSSRSACSRTASGMPASAIFVR